MHSKAILAANLADDKKAENILALDVEKLCSFADAFVICTAGSTIQVRAIADHLLESMKKAGHRGTAEGMESLQWVILDFGDIIVHVMTDEKRAFYNLEGLWGDAPTIAWQGGAAN
jgi:ribosome-associated protein